MIREAREAVAVALTDLGIPVHRYAPGAVTSPAAVLVWGAPLLEPRTACRYLVGIDVRIVVSSAAGSVGQASLDDMVDEAVALLVAAGIRVDVVQTPSPDPETATLTAVIAAFVSIDERK